MAPKDPGKGSKLQTPPPTDKTSKNTDKQGSTSASKNPAKPTEIPTPDKPARSHTKAGVHKKKSTRTRTSSVRNAIFPPKRTRDPELTAVLQASDITVLVPGDKEYERAVASSNLLYRFSRPTYVVRPQNKEQVSLIVKEAVHRQIPITVKNGGHSYIGSSFPNDGIMLDLKEMNQVSVEKYVSEFSSWLGHLELCSGGPKQT